MAISYRSPCLASIPKLLVFLKVTVSATLSPSSVFPYAIHPNRAKVTVRRMGNGFGVVTYTLRNIKIHAIATKPRVMACPRIYFGD